MTERARRRGARRGPKPGSGMGYYRGKEKRAVSITLTKLAKAILAAAERRTGQTRSNVVENLLREHGATVEFPKQTDEAA